MKQTQPTTCLGGARLRVGLARLLFLGKIETDLRFRHHHPRTRSQHGNSPGRSADSTWYSSNCAAVAQAWLGRISRRVPTGRTGSDAPLHARTWNMPCSWLASVTIRPVSGEPSSSATTPKASATRWLSAPRARDSHNTAACETLQLCPTWGP